MNPSEDLKALLIDAFLLSEDLIKNSKKIFYKQNSQELFDSVSIPFIQEGILADQILEILHAQNRLDRPYSGEVRRTKVRNETLGFLRITRPSSYGEPTKFSIKIEASLNTCWYRFVLLKELCQIYCDFEKDYTPKQDISPESQIYDLLNLTRVLNTNPQLFAIKVTDDNYTEFLSFYVAINLIFPRKYWDSFGQLTRPESVGEEVKYKYKLYDIANAHKMPEFVMKFFVKELLPFYESIDFPVSEQN